MIRLAQALIVVFPLFGSGCCFLGIGRCRGNNGLTPVSALAAHLGSSWLVLAEPNSAITPAWSYNPGAGYRDDCFVADSVIAGESWGEFAEQREEVHKGSFGLTILKAVGIEILPDRLKSSTFKSWGWRSNLAQNVRINPESSECLGAASVPPYAVISEVLVFDTLEITLLDRNNSSLSLSAAQGLGAVRLDSLKWEPRDSNRVFARGDALAVGIRVAFWRVQDHRVCIDTLSTFAQGVESICAPRDNAQMSVKVEGDMGGYYRVWARDDSKPGGNDRAKTLGLGSRWDLEVTHLRWARLFLERSPEGTPYVQVRFEDTRYETEPYIAMKNVDSAAAARLPPLWTERR